MNCQTYSNKIMKYFDGDLNDIDYAQLKQHMKTCTRCSEEFESLNKILGQLESTSAIEPPVEFDEEVMTKIRAVDMEEKKNINVLMYAVPIIIVISLSTIFTVWFMGGTVFDMLSRIFGQTGQLPDALAVVFSIFTALFTVMSNIVRGMFEASVVTVKTYYYIFVMLASMLFAIQWMVVSLVRQSWGGVAR